MADRIQRMDSGIKHGKCARGNSEFRTEEEKENQVKLLLFFPQGFNEGSRKWYLGLLGTSNLKRGIVVTRARVTTPYGALRQFTGPYGLHANGQERVKRFRIL